MVFVVPGLSRAVLLESLLYPALLLLCDLPAVTGPQVNQHQSIIQQAVFHLPVQTGVCGEAGGVVNLNTQFNSCIPLE